MIPRDVNKAGRFYEVVRFLLVGGLCFGIDFSLLYALTEFFSWHYLWSAAVSFTVSLLVNYWLCLVFVFKAAKKRTWRQATVFAVLGVAGLLINQFVMWFVAGVIGFHYTVAKLFAAVVVAVWNYFTKRSAVQGVSFP